MVHYLIHIFKQHRQLLPHFEQQIMESEELYKKEPTRFSIQCPRQEDIMTKLKANFGFEKIEDFLTSRRKLSI